VIRAGLRRVFAFLLLVLGGVAAISATVGALAGKSIPHSLAIGYYLAGSGCLVMSFVIGSRGPTRAESADDDDAEDQRRAALMAGFGVPRGGRVGRRNRRKATPEERRAARLSSIGLFVFGLLLILLAAAFDPSRRAF
jgi:hypothetical protein